MNNNCRMRCIPCRSFPVGRGRIDDDHNGIKSLLKARKVSSRHSVPAKIRPRDRDSSGRSVGNATGQMSESLPSVLVSTRLA
ncbi:hypothetical protein NKJ50_25300 [Mesorhizobium sp. M0115]|uniref:hypothetical protein n=1 Tax=Mesorhizobium sp. M0115 TaxID=2956883 RepID=UPI00333CBBA3